MLKSLSITNFAIIDELNMNFSKGFTTITGETGAGKSIILGALKLVLGKRAHLDSLKNKKKKCVVEAIFYLNSKQIQDKIKPILTKNDLDYEDETIIRREILPSEKSRAFVNDTPVNLHVLKALSQELIDIHSQFNTTDLLRLDYQLEILDAIAKHATHLSQYQKEFKRYQDQKQWLAKQSKELEEINKQADYFSFLLTELQEANLNLGEKETLEQQQEALSNAQNIIEVLQEINQQIHQDNFGLQQQINLLQHNVQKLAKYSNQFGKMQERLDHSLLEIHDLLDDLSQHANDFELNPTELNQTNERLDLINRLLKKHNVNSIEELLIIQEDLEQKTSDSVALEQEISQGQVQLKNQQNKVTRIAEEISKNRKNSIPKVCAKILKNLSKMGMENSTIQIQLLTNQEFNKYGKDKVKILFSANQGIEPKEIEKAVSGGEQSRLMLAIKQLIAENQSLPSLILDEIDSGVSGKIANEMALLMKEMANQSQIISITHLPQVAAKGNKQFKVYKDKSNVKTQVKLLSSQERIQEIAELLSGKNISSAAIQQAKELLN